MNVNIIALPAALAALGASAFFFPIVRRFAIYNKVVDVPNARKLQRVPVPVLGGLVVFLGIVAGRFILSRVMGDSLASWSVVFMTIMLILGTWDDVKSLPAGLRFFIEFSLMGAFITLTGVYIDSFHGLWDIYELPRWVGIPLSLIIGVGIVNAINMIDGVDGYSSGYGMMACAFFAAVYYHVNARIMANHAVIVMAALIPFFLHNVFGKKSKMFIGDGGTLMLGMLITIFTFYTLWSGGKCNVLQKFDVGLVAFTVAVGCVPLFDTLRVMFMRMARGVSPFRPDKTHLHHLFIDMGFSHLGAALSILLMNMIVVFAWLLLYKKGASVEMQLYVVIVMGLLITVGFYKFMKVQQVGGPVDEEGYPEGSRIWHAFQKLGEWSHREKGVLWRMMTKFVDTMV